MPEVREERPLQTEEGEAEGIKVVIAVPSMEYVPMSFAYDLATLVGFTSRHFVRDGAIGGLSLLRVSGTYLHKSRETLARQAIASGADYIFWLDSDMRFPRDALVRLLMHEEGLVGCNYAKRGIPPEYVAIKRTADENGPGEVLKTEPDSTGLEEAEVIGFGCALIHADVFRSLDPTERWFFFAEENGLHVGEDTWFCRKARAAGWKVLVDHDLSKELAHTGTYEYTLDATHAFYAAQEETD